MDGTSFSLIEKLAKFLIPPQVEGARIQRDTAVQAASRGGMLGGLCLALAIIGMRNGGFEGSGTWDPLKVWATAFLCGFFGGAVAARMSAWYAFPMETSRKQSGILSNASVFLAGFLTMFLVHQLAARDSLVAPHGHIKTAVDDDGKPLTEDREALLQRISQAERTTGSVIDEVGLRRQRYKDKSGEFTVILDGGPLGEPSFEGIALAFLGGVALLSFARQLRKHAGIGPRFLVPGKRAAWEPLLSGVVWGMVAWAIAASISWALLEGGVLPKERPPFAGSRAIFVAEYPHVERVALFAPLVFVFLLIILRALSLYAEEPKGRPVGFASQAS